MTSSCEGSAYLADLMAKGQLADWAQDSLEGLPPQQRFVAPTHTGPGLVTVPLAGAAYEAQLEGKPQIHIIEINAEDEPVRVLCKVNLENVLDDVSQFNKHDATCKTCIARARKEMAR